MRYLNTLSDFCWWSTSTSPRSWHQFSCRLNHFQMSTWNHTVRKVREWFQQVIEEGGCYVARWSSASAMILSWRRSRLVSSMLTHWRADRPGHEHPSEPPFQAKYATCSDPNGASQKGIWKCASLQSCCKDSKACASATRAIWSSKGQETKEFANFTVPESTPGCLMTIPQRVVGDHSGTKGRIPTLNSSDEMHTPSACLGGTVALWGQSSRLIS